MKAQSPKVLIIGGRGRMGALFAALFKKHGCRVSVLDKGDALPLGPFRAEIVLLSVPLDQVASITRRIKKHLPKDALLCDISSLKEEISKVMASTKSKEVVGLHPMFGPTVKGIAAQTIVWCGIREGKKARWLRSILKKEGARLTECTPQRHDKMMAHIQALTHLNKMALGLAWARSGISAKEAAAFVSPVYALERAMVGRLFTQSPELYAEIEIANPYAKKAQRELSVALEELVGTITRGDRRGFRSRFLEVQRYLGPQAREALGISDSAVAQVFKRGKRT